MGRCSFIGFAATLGAALVARPTAATPTRWPPSSSRASPGAPAGGRGRGRAVHGRRGRLFGYDLVRTVEPLGEPNPDPVGLPDMALMLSDCLLIFDHLKHTVTILVNANLDAEPDLERAYASGRGEIASRARGACRAGPRESERGASRREMPVFESNMAARGVRSMVARIVRYIHAGDAFQVVPSQRWSAPSAGRAVLDLPRPARGQPESRTCTSSTSATSRSREPAPSRC